MTTAEMEVRVNTILKRLAIVPLALAIGGVVPAYSQNTTDHGPQGARDAAKTGAGPRGTAVGPSTNPAEPTPSVGQRTGEGPHGSKAGPTTNPAQPKNPAQPTNK